MGPEREARGPGAVESSDLRKARGLGALPDRVAACPIPALIVSAPVVTFVSDDGGGTIRYEQAGRSSSRTIPVP